MAGCAVLTLVDYRRRAHPILPLAKHTAEGPARNVTIHDTYNSIPSSAVKGAATITRSKCRSIGDCKLAERAGGKYVVEPGWVRGLQFRSDEEGRFALRTQQEEEHIGASAIPHERMEPEQ